MPAAERQSTNEELQRETRSDGFDDHPSVSADGKYLLFVERDRSDDFYADRVIRKVEPRLSKKSLRRRLTARNFTRR